MPSDRRTPERQESQSLGDEWVPSASDYGRHRMFSDFSSDTAYLCDSFDGRMKVDSIASRLVGKTHIWTDLSTDGNGEGMSGIARWPASGSGCCVG